MNKKNILITGCSSGFGKRTAYFLREKGWYVYATARREENVQSLKKEGFNSFRLDLASSQSIKDAVAKILEHAEGNLTALMNNAGYSQIGAIEDLSRDSIRDQFEVNVFGTMELTSMLIPIMRKQGYGKIIFISSVNGRFTFPFFGAYCASKYAIESFCDALRREMRGTKIFITAIEPGLFKTNSVQNAECVFFKNIDQKESVHRQTYQKIFGNFQNAMKKIPEEKTTLIAKTVYKVLQDKKPQSRIIVPKASMIYEIAHRFLPDYLQDYLYFMKLRYLDRI